MGVRVTADGREQGPIGGNSRVMALFREEVKHLWLSQLDLLLLEIKQKIFYIYSAQLPLVNLWALVSLLKNRGQGLLSPAKPGSEYHQQKNPFHPPMEVQTLSPEVQASTQASAGFQCLNLSRS